MILGFRKNQSPCMMLQNVCCSVGIGIGIVQNWLIVNVRPIGEIATCTFGVRARFWDENPHLRFDLISRLSAEHVASHSVLLTASRYRAHPSFQYALCSPGVNNKLGTTTSRYRPSVRY